MQRPEFIEIEVRATMSRKEQDFIVLLSRRKYTKSQIKRMLYIETDNGYYRLRKKVQKKISRGINVENVVPLA